MTVKSTNIKKFVEQLSLFLLKRDLGINNYDDSTRNYRNSFTGKRH